ncbi:hypothetical protein MKEN_00066600 [Mycena kentingensis (nom. inval.)]|nr:hypothetical protein MKEN_00066600 [Mycena kentingensis (nom. inval.)]
MYGPYAAPQQQAQPQQPQVTPNQVVYTTSTDSNNRIVYHPFKAVAASYQTPNGIISGIQWVPAESTLVLPTGARPADADFAAAWSRTPITKEEQKALKEWQRDEEKRRKKEEKEAKRQREKGIRAGVDHGDAELRKARERDAQAAAKERRKSFNQGQGMQPFPTAGANPYQPANPGYPTTPYTAGYAVPPSAGLYEPRERKTSANVTDLNQQFGEMGLGMAGQPMPRPAQYQTDAERTRKMSGNFGQPGAYPPNTYGASPYPAYPAGAPGYPATANPYSNPSPSMRPGESPQPPYSTTTYVNASYPAGTVPGHPATPYAGAVYPPGHVMEGKPIPAGATPPIPPSAAASYMTAGPPPAGYPQMQVPVADSGDQGQLPAPEGFSRPVNTHQLFTPFEKMKVQDMNELVINAPRMPVALQSHDVLPSDWGRLMQDLCLAWTGKLPAPGRSNRKSTLTADLIDLWNQSFFFARGVEIILYKGRERRSGPHAGIEDIQLPIYDAQDDSSSSSSSSSSSDSDSDDDEPRYPSQMYNMYGQPQPGQDWLEQKRRRRELRAEKKRRRKEKKAKKKAKARETRYALYLACVPQGYTGMASATGMGAGAMGLGAMRTGVPGQAVMHGMTPMSGSGMHTSPAAGYGAVAGGMPMTGQASYGQPGYPM